MVTIGDSPSEWPSLFGFGAEFADHSQLLIVCTVEHLGLVLPALFLVRTLSICDSEEPRVRDERLES